MGGPLDVRSGQKYVYSLKRKSDDEKFVLLLSKTSYDENKNEKWALDVNREMEVFKALKQHERKNKDNLEEECDLFLKFDFYDLGSDIRPPSMVVEKVEPLGYDLIEQMQQY